MPAGADCEKGGLGSIRRRRIIRSGTHGHNHRRTTGPVPGTWPAHPHRQPQAYDRRKRRNTADTRRNGQHRTRGRCLILVMSASGSVAVARWPVPVCICTGPASTRRGGLVGESTRGVLPSRPPAGLVGSAPGRPAGGPSEFDERWHQRSRLVLPGRLGIWGLGCARGWACGRHWRRLATRRAVVWRGGGPRNAPTGCSQHLEAGRSTALGDCRLARIGACSSKTVFGVGLYKMHNNRCYPGTPPPRLRRRLGLRFHGEPGRILCGLLTIDSVSMLTLPQLHCPLFVFSAAAMPTSTSQCMPAGRRFCRHRPNQQASLRAWGCPRGLGVFGLSCANVPARLRLPLRKGEAQLH